MALDQEARKLGLCSHEPAPVQLELVLGGAASPQILALDDEPVDLGTERFDSVLEGIHFGVKVRAGPKNPL